MAVLPLGGTTPLFKGTMKKEYKKQKGENLAQWCERIAAACQGRSLEEVHEMIREVSVTSYTEGVHAERAISKKYGRAEETIHD